MEPAEEISDRPVHLAGLLQRDEMPGARQTFEPCVREGPRHVLRVLGRREPVFGPDDDERGMSRSHFQFCRIRYPKEGRESDDVFGYLLYVKLSHRQRGGIPVSTSIG
jgi:hypothetical protein